MIAEVITDVSAHPVDRPFDYLVPQRMETVIERGARVKVPFGNRKVLGFVTGFKEQSDIPVNKLRPIDELLDLEPVLTGEMLDLADWMKRETLCFEIDALQVMLPSALRAKYEKVIHVLEPDRIGSEAAGIIGSRNAVALKEFPERLLPSLKRLSQEGAISIETGIRQRTSIKKERVLHIAGPENLADVREGIKKSAHRQAALIDWMLAHAGETIPTRDVMELTGTTRATVKALLEKGAAAETEVEVYRKPEVGLLDEAGGDPVMLTDEQADAVSRISRAADEGREETFLLHGITGSGKTEVYMQVIRRVLEQGKEAIVLVPEISLTPQITSRFKKRFGPLVAVMHSGLSAGEKYDEWRKVQRGEVKVVVGARSAVFAPFRNLGAVILDEEHESSYKQEDSPRYHARDVAIRRAEMHGCPVILGSATPSLESFARAHKGVYTLLTLSERAKQQPLPEVRIVDMREELKNGNRSMFSVDLAEAIRDRLGKGEQTVLFLNRRGYSSFVLCRDCGTAVQCPNCDISLTYHRASERLQCHYCGHEEPVPLICPECGSEHIRFFGTGTQKVQEELHRLFPEARVLRMDVDTTRQKGAHEKLLRQFGDGEADILLGTQMIAKGLDFPNITLVGVLSADTMLRLSDFRAAEKTFQLLTQVSGRAGRHEKEGQVYIQTYAPEHYAVELSKEQAFEPFYAIEMANRKRFSYPPFYYITLIRFSHEDLMTVADTAEKAVAWLAGKLGGDTVIIGPTASEVARVNNRYRYQCLIKYKKEPKLAGVLTDLVKIYRSSWMKEGLLMSIDMNPSSIS
ncbi:primosomal protein N' [Edaphobacillus lindanitolerans]|uniref:Replication restart protein PriA n=1 Tax=Edaphobacillus lindanitolerans TaxID=550447 RepID=A0A1U7PLI5_9BACI|nr:primosomal protein N' [Edaphobacillus lindanitolerans]SIT67623.1 replication restart DNA helicase PriA [Edaphobacillus lindanitolerans]